LRDEEKNRLTGISYSLVGFLITALAFERDIAILAILFLSLGDSAATVVGVWKGRILLWGRSNEGSVACLAICFSVGLPVANVLENLTLPVAIAGAVFATIFQALPIRVNDNLTIPIGSALVMLVTSVIT
jgi:glycerol-3-phosphate acyltransferase PlsY